MRSDIAASIIDAFDNPGASSLARVSLGKARHFSRTFSSVNAGAFAQPAGIQDAPLPQDGKVIGGLFWSVFVNAGEIWLAHSFMSPARPTMAGAPLNCDALCRPAIISRNNDSFVVFYTLGTAIYQAEIDGIAFQAGQDSVVSNAQIYDPGKYCSLHAIASDLVMAVFVDDGGVRAARLAYATGWGWLEWGGRFMFPGDNCQETDTYRRAQLNYSAAVRLANEVFVYLSAPDGSVMGVILRTDTSVWSDSFEAVPADLSRFAVGNALVYGGVIYLCGQFQRVDADALFISTHVYGLLLSSGDGRTFSMDRYTAFTGGETEEANSPALRWMAGIAARPDAGYEVDGLAAIYSDTNRWVALPAHQGLSGVVGDITIQPIVSARGDLNGTITIAISNTDGRYTDLINVGDVLDLDVGVQTSENVTEWIRLMRMVVAGVKESYADGDLRLSVSARPLTAGRLDDMTHPFAVHLQGRSAIRDSLVDFENFERAKDDGYVIFPFAADFWDGQSKVEPGSHGAYGEAEISTGDVKNGLGLVDYPIIDTLPFEIHLFGWSRSGNPTPYEGGSGDLPSNLDAPNDRVFCRLYISRNGAEAEARDIETVQTGSENHFPQTWYKTEAGSYPVILLASEDDDLQAGDQIVKVEMVYANDRAPNLAETVFFPERVEIPAVAMRVDSFDETWAPVPPVEDFPDEWNFALDNDGWYWQTATEPGDGIVSYGWNYAIGCRYIRCMQIDLSTPLDIPNTYPDGCGNSGPNTFATGAGRFSFDMPKPAIATASSTFSAVIDSVHRRDMVSPSGSARLAVHFTDGSYVSATVEGVNGGDELYQTKVTLTIPAEHAGKQVAKLGLIGGGRGYIVRFYSATIEGFEPLDTEANDDGQELMRVGLPVVYFAEKPYYSINAVATAKYHLDGDNAYGGVCILASDGNNYIAARASIDTVELIKVRSGLATVLASAAYVWPEQYGWFLLRHIDGVFEVRVKDSGAKVWSMPVITYQWGELDGPLLADPDISHVGLYALKDAPYVRLCSFDPGISNRAGILPGAHRWADFTSTGVVRIEDVLYSYTGKVDAALVKGPYQGRNVSGPYNYASDGANYSGVAAEFTRFDWQNNGGHKDDFDDEHMATDTGIVWPLSAVDHKPTITTKGVTVHLKNRGRFFSAYANGDVIGMEIPVWITHALTGLALSSGEPVTHGKGSIAYLVNDCTVQIYEFAAASGYDDLTDRDAIERIARISRGTPRFPGDVVVASKALSTTAWRIAV